MIDSVPDNITAIAPMCHLKPRLVVFLIILLTPFMVTIGNPPSCGDAEIALYYLLFTFMSIIIQA